MVRQVMVGRTFAGQGTYRGEVEPLRAGPVVLAVRLVFEGDVPTVYVYGIGQDGCSHKFDDNGDTVVTVETVDDFSLRQSLGFDVARLMGVRVNDVIWPLHLSDRKPIREHESPIGIGVY